MFCLHEVFQQQVSCLKQEQNFLIQAKLSIYYYNNSDNKPDDMFMLGLCIETGNGLFS